MYKIYTKRSIQLFDENLLVFKSISQVPPRIHRFRIHKDFTPSVQEPTPSFKTIYISIENIYQAYLKARVHKNNTRSCIEFKMNLLANIYKLYRELNDGTYKISPSSCFCVTTPNLREVFAADFRDRIVHHLIVDIYQKYFEYVFPEDVYACRPKKGNLYGARRLKEYAESQDWKGTILKHDFKSYFVSIDKLILYKQLVDIANIIIENDEDYKEWVLWLTHKIVFDCPQFNCIVIQSRSMWNNLPPDKTMFNRDKDHGLPVGNHTSQWFANLYLLVIDMFIIDELGLGMYGRYVDDFYIVVPENFPLCPKEISNRISEKCKEINLKLHPNKVYIQPLENGCDFAGHFIKPRRILIRKRTTNHLKLIMHAISLMIENNQIDEKIALNALKTLNSYFGMLVNGNTYNLRKRLMIKYESVFKPYLRHDKKYRKYVVVSNS